MIAASATAATVAAWNPALADDKSVDQRGPGLHAHARAKGLFFGGALSSYALSNDNDLLNHFLIECGMLVGEESFKWDSIRYDQTKFDFARADALMGFALFHQLKVRGHTLVWHEATPAWLEPALTSANIAEKMLTDHIRAVAGRYAGRLAHWDVVNEVFDLQDKKPRGLRDTLWLRALGPAYIDIAFHATAEADPHALRTINEFGIEYGVDWQARKRGALLDLCADMVSRRVPVQAVGIQAHLDPAEQSTVDQKSLARFIADIASLGLKVVVTEFDVRDQTLPTAIPARDAAIAAHARAWLDAVLPNPAVLGVLSWGLSDRATWLNGSFPRADNLPQRPLPLDADLSRKKLWAAMAASFDAVAPRQGRI
jgi:endo-1,4-beta-xylanase